MCKIFIFDQVKTAYITLLIIFLLHYIAHTSQHLMDLVKWSQSDFRKQCESNYPNHSNKKLCQLPPQPHYGGYTAVNRPGAKPGDVFENVTLISFITDENSELAAVTRHACSCGIWAHKLISDEGACSPLYSEEGIKSEDEYKQEKDAKNVPSKSKENVDQENVLHKPDIRGDDCYLEPHKSVRYQCGDENRDCSREVAHGIAVTPRCAHLHYSAKPLPPMVCSDGQWNYVATCLSECGTNGNDYPRTLAPGKEVKISELPWHAGIYSKDFTPFKQICGGSIIATNLVLTAAHCFWSDVEKLKQPSRFAVAAGQLGRAWDYRGTGLEQKRDVADIKIPSRFRGSQTSFQDDVAMVFLAAPLVYTSYVLPVCLDFDLDFDRKQLVPGNLGQVAGWGLTSENGEESPVLLYENLPYVDIDKCIDNAPRNFRRFITSDKICAGYTNGTALCRGDSGGGLVFRGLHESKEKGDRLRYYLRGIASTAPTGDNLCNLHAITSFTHLLQHERFIRDYYSGTY